MSVINLDEVGTRGLSPSLPVSLSLSVCLPTWCLMTPSLCFHSQSVTLKITSATRLLLHADEPTAGHSGKTLFFYVTELRNKPKKHIYRDVSPPPPPHTAPCSFYTHRFDIAQQLYLHAYVSVLFISLITDILVFLSI